MVMITPGKGKRKHSTQQFSSRVKCLLKAVDVGGERETRPAVARVSCDRFSFDTGYWGGDREHAPG